ncbi:MAG: nucleotidyltransferase domain-containing protein [Thermoplasmata archaeon]|nr:nucleotidyltransferase domain-containing protein [Thermoplasmata archaeon]
MGGANPEVIPILREFRRRVAKKFGIERMILFGSQVTDKRRKDSDIDLLIVSKRKRKLSLLSKLYHEWHVVQEIGYPVDFVCYTPEEFEELRKRVTIVREAVREGVEIA